MLCKDKNFRLSDLNWMKTNITVTETSTIQESLQIAGKYSEIMYKSANEVNAIDSCLCMLQHQCLVRTFCKSLSLKIFVQKSIGAPSRGKNCSTSSNISSGQSQDNAQLVLATTLTKIISVVVWHSVTAPHRKLKDNQHCYYNCLGRTVKINVLSVSSKTLAGMAHMTSSVHSP